MKHSRACNYTPITVAVFILDGLLLLFLIFIICYLTKLNISNVVSPILEISSLAVAIAALCVACKIPFRIMQNQLYVDLMREYRSENMLRNIDIIRAACSYKGDYKCCKCNGQVCAVVKNIRDGKDLGVCKHQRQSVSQWYWQLACLLFSGQYYGCLRKIRKLIKDDFTMNDSHIICIVYHLNYANDERILDKPISRFTKRLKKLLCLSKQWKE
jgi:hypothetical protein